MEFGNVKTEQGIAKVDAHMKTSSYVSGFNLSGADVELFDKMVGMPNSVKFPNAARWYRLIASYPTSQRNAMKTAAPASAPAAAEEEVDLFGDDSAAAAPAKPAAAAPAKKAPKPKPVAKSSVTMDAMPYDAEKPITEVYADIKQIAIDGLLWGQPFTVINGPFGLKGIQFGCVIEDEKVKLVDIEEAVETLGMSGEAKEKFLEMRRSGDLEDYDDEWPGKIIGSTKIVSFQKI